MEEATSIFLGLGPPGAAIVVLGIVIGLMARHIVGLYRRIDELHGLWRVESNNSITSITTALETVKATITHLNSQNRG